MVRRPSVPTMARMTRATLALLLAGIVALAGCGSGGAGSPASAPDPSRASHPRSDPAASTASTAASSSAAAGSPTPSAAPRRHGSGDRGAHRGSHDRGRHKVGELAPHSRTDEAHLLDADRLPTVGGRAWTVESDAPTGAVGACQKTDLGTIGATTAVGRSFRAGDGVTATQVVARFADAKSAWRAQQVLVAWREDCESRVAGARVGPLRPVPVTSGTGDSYRGRFAARKAGLGVLRTGSYLTLVEVSARRAGYPTSPDPTRVAVRRIARTF